MVMVSGSSTTSTSTVLYAYDALRFLLLYPRRCSCSSCTQAIHRHRHACCTVDPPGMCQLRETSRDTEPDAAQQAAGGCTIGACLYVEVFCGGALAELQNVIHMQLIMAGFKKHVRYVIPTTGM